MFKNLAPLWLLICLLVLIDALGLPAAGIAVTLPSLLAVVCIVAMLLGVALIYSRLRPDPRLACMSSYAAALFAYSAAAGLLSYLSVTWRRPLIDAPLDRFDHLTKLDWLALYHWVVQHPPIHLALALAYNSILAQIALLIVLLVTLRRFDRLREFMTLYVTSSLIYVLLGGLWPAMGAFGTYHAGMDTPYFQDFIALRDGTLGPVNMMKIQGLVQFPSFHLALAIIYIYAVRGIKFWFPFFLCLNALLVLSTPSIGGHYFADLWGTVILLPLIFVAVKKSLRHNSTITGT